MLIACETRRGRGLTLVELTVALALLGLVLALIARIGTGLRRQLALAAVRGAALEQLRDAASILPLDLRGLSSVGGDIPPGGATDSSFQAQVTMATGVLCATSGTHALITLGTRADGTTRRGVPDVGDTLWLLVDRDSAERWVGLAARAARQSPVPCAFARAPETAAVLDSAHALDVDAGVLLGDSAVAPVSETDSALAALGAGTPVRITRPLRYRVYRGPDGGWYLGLQEWSPSAGRFATVQPLSGPYGFAPSESGGLRFHYFDSAGVTVPSRSLDTRRITRVELALLGGNIGSLPRDIGRTPDSLRIVVALRNWRR